jgi:glutaredoxin
VYDIPGSASRATIVRQLSQAKLTRLIHASSMYTDEHDDDHSTDQEQDIDGPRVYVDGTFIGSETELQQYLGIQEHIRQPAGGSDRRCFLAITATWCGYCVQMKELLHWYDSDVDGVQTYSTASTSTVCLTMTGRFNPAVLMQPTKTKIVYPTIFEYIHGKWVHIHTHEYKALVSL